MAGLLTSSEQDMLGNIIQQRQQANQALGSGYGKYGGIVQAAAGMANTGADAIAGGGVGAADPRMQNMQAAKAIMTKVAQEVGNVTSAAFYERLSQELAQSNFPEQAQKAADKAMEIKKTEFAMKPKAAEKKTQVVDIDGEKLLIDSLSGETIRNLGGTGKLKDIKTQVVSANGRELLINSVTGETIKDLGVSKSDSPIINIAGNQENEFAKARAKNQADELRDAKKAAGSSLVALNALKQMENVNLKGIYSGPQAETLVAANSFLESVGLLNKDQVSKLTDSVTYDKNAKDLVMLDLDGKLGAQISDADRKYVEARIPQLRTNPQARTELIAKLREIHSNKIDKAEKMKEWANKYNNLNDFKWEPKVSTPSSQGMSKEDNALINKYLNPKKD